MSHLETRKSLIIRLKNEHAESAWRDFVCTYEAFLNRLVSRHGVPPRHVPDVTQQILMVIAKSVDRWQDDGNPASFRRWLGSVSRNVVIRFMARERRQAGGVGGSEVLAALGAVETPPDQNQLKCYRYELILWAAEQVRHDFLDSSWRAFWFTVIEQRPVEEVARELGVSAGSIYMSRSRIMSRIKEKVAEVDEL